MTFNITGSHEHGNLRRPLLDDFARSASMAMGPKQRASASSGMLGGGGGRGRYWQPAGRGPRDSREIAGKALSLSATGGRGST